MDSCSVDDSSRLSRRRRRPRRPQSVVLLARSDAARSATPTSRDAAADSDAAAAADKNTSSATRSGTNEPFLDSPAHAEASANIQRLEDALGVVSPGSDSGRLVAELDAALSALARECRLWGDTHEAIALLMRLVDLRQASHDSASGSDASRLQLAAAQHALGTTIHVSLLPLKHKIVYRECNRRRHPGESRKSQRLRLVPRASLQAALKPLLSGGLTRAEAMLHSALTLRRASLEDVLRARKSFTAADATAPTTDASVVAARRLVARSLSALAALQSMYGLQEDADEAHLEALRVFAAEPVSASTADAPDASEPRLWCFDASGERWIPAPSGSRELAAARQATTRRATLLEQERRASVAALRQRVVARGDGRSSSSSGGTGILRTLGCAFSSKRKGSGGPLRESRNPLGPRESVLGPAAASRAVVPQDMSATVLRLALMGAVSRRHPSKTARPRALVLDPAVASRVAFGTSEGQRRSSATRLLELSSSDAAREHAEAVYDADTATWTLRDCSGVVLVNGVRVRRVALAEGDVVMFCSALAITYGEQLPNYAAALASAPPPTPLVFRCERLFPGSARLLLQDPALDGGDEDVNDRLADMMHPSVFPAELGHDAALAHFHALVCAEYLRQRHSGPAAGAGQDGSPRARDPVGASVRESRAIMQRARAQGVPVQHWATYVRAQLRMQETERFTRHHRSNELDYFGI